MSTVVQSGALAEPDRFSPLTLVDVRARLSGISVTSHAEHFALRFNVLDLVELAFAAAGTDFAGLVPSLR